MYKCKHSWVIPCCCGAPCLAAVIPEPGRPALEALLDALARTEPLLAEAIACTEQSGDQLIAYGLGNNAGVHALRAGTPCRPGLPGQAAQAAWASGEETSAVLVNLGWVLRQDGDPDGARSMFEAGLRIGRRNVDRSDRANYSA